VQNDLAQEQCCNECSAIFRTESNGGDVIRRILAGKVNFVTKLGLRAEKMAFCAAGKRPHKARLPAICWKVLKIKLAWPATPANRPPKPPPRNLLHWNGIAVCSRPSCKMGWTRGAEARKTP